MIEYAIPKTHAVIPEPHVKTIGLVISILFLMKILLNSSLDLKVFVSAFIQSLKGRFFDPTMQPLLSPDLGSSTFPSNLSRLLASTV